MCSANPSAIRLNTPPNQPSGLQNKHKQIKYINILYKCKQTKYMAILHKTKTNKIHCYPT